MTTLSNLRPGQSLSPREKDVLVLIVDGCANKEIAVKLNIGLKTVEQFIGAIFVKMDVTSRTQAAVKAIREGVV